MSNPPALRVVILKGGPLNGRPEQLRDWLGNGREPNAFCLPIDGGGAAWYERGENGEYGFSRMQEVPPVRSTSLAEEGSERERKRGDEPLQEGKA